MKKWENPKIQDVNLKVTEAVGPQLLKNCDHPVTLDLLPDELGGQCYGCPCCPEEFHSDKYPNGTAYTECEDHIAKKHGSQCS